MRAAPFALLVLVAAGCEGPPERDAFPARDSTGSLAPDAPPGASSSADLTADSLVVRAPYAVAAPAGGTAAAFFSVMGGPADDTLRAARTDAAGRVEIHESFEADGLRGMRPVAGVPVPAGRQTRLAPGGFHVMLMETARALAPGDTLRLELEFARAGRRQIEVPVRSLDEAMAPRGSSGR